MNSKTIVVIAAAVVIIMMAAFIASKGGNPQGPSVTGEWEEVQECSGTWNDGIPLYGEGAGSGGKVKITHHEGDFYLFDDGSQKLYCSWDGNKMLTAGLQGSTGAVFIATLPDNMNFMTVSYFSGQEAVIDVYKRAGYVGEFPGLGIQADIPETGSVIESYKVREYTEDGPTDVAVNTMTIKSVSGSIMFFDVVGTDGYMAENTAVYLDGGMFMSLATFGELSAFEMIQYRDGVFYSSTVTQGAGDIWMVEYGDESSASYPDKNLEETTYTGTEEAVIYKDGKIVERINGNGIALGVLMQDDSCLEILTVDDDGNEIAVWTAMFYDLKSTNSYGISVQSSITYKDVTYRGCYFGEFDSKNCRTLNIHGVLLSESGQSIVISQKYTMDNTQ